MSNNKDKVRELMKVRFSEDINDFDEKMNKADKYMDGLKELMKLAGEEPDREGLEETPYRVLKAFMEYTEGYLEDPKEHLKKIFNVDHHEMVLVKDIDFYSMCEHHFAPIIGKVHVAYIPNGKVTGLSKIGRMVDGYAKRFQVQERMSNQIADAMVDVLDPLGVMVVIEGKHMCMSGRGVKKHNAITTTTSTRGLFKEDTMKRMEFLTLLDR